MALLTRDNAKCGCIVKRGPAWQHGTQDQDAIYGLVVGLVVDEHQMPYGVNVRWIGAKQQKLREKSYTIPADEKDMIHANLELSNAFQQENPNEDAQVGEVRPYISEDAMANWNNALELAIDTVMDNKTRSVIAEKLATFKK